MSVAALPRIDDCAHCDSPEGETICEACANEEKILAMRAQLLRMKTVAPGLTNAEIELIERFIDGVDAA